MSDSSNAAQSRQSVFDRLRGPLTLLMIALGGFALYYSLFFERKTTYFRERNGRLAGRLADQIRRSIANAARMVSGAASVPVKSDMEKLYSFDRGLSEEQRQPQAIFDDIKLVEDRDGNHKERRSAEMKDGQMILKFEGATAAKVVEAPFDVAAPSPDRSGQPKRYVSASIPLQRLINSIVTQTARDVFDTVFILDNGGNVIYQSTPRPEDESASNIRIVRLTELRLPKLVEEEGTLQVSDLMSASRQMAVRIGDANYQLFSVPVRSTIAVAGEPQPQPAAKDARPGFPADTWIVCGVVSNAAFRASSLAISVTVLCCVGAALLLTFFSWPFAKMAMSSPQVKVTLMDVILLGTGGILATSIVCLVVLDWFAFRKLEATADRQLEGLASTITGNFRAEAVTVMGQLDRIQAWAEKEIREKRAKPRNGNLLETFRSDGKPFFQSVALISATGGKGKQEVKWFVDNAATPLANVSNRRYFSGPLRESRDYLFLAGRRVTIESIRSTTTGQPEVVFARRTKDSLLPGNEQNAEIRKRLPIIAMSVPAPLSVIDPILPRDFGFAIIDQSGTVLFHSERQRNTVENFFAESDDDPRIKAAVEARQNEHLNIRYWGDDYRAFVQPMKDLPWTLITFREKSSLRTINAEALVITLIFLVAIFGVTLLAFIGLVLLLKPRYRADWIWPDPARVGSYAELSAAYLALLAVATVVLLGLGDGALLAFPFWFIALVLVVTYLYLRADLRGLKRIAFVTITAILTGGLLVLMWRGSTGGWPDVAMGAAAVLLVAIGARASLRLSERAGPQRARELQTSLPLCYVGAAFLLLLLTSAVPAAAFFKAAYEMEMGSYIKSVQMKLAADLQSRWWRVSWEFDDERGKGKKQYLGARWHDPRDIYAEAAYDTSIRLDSKPALKRGLRRSASELPDVIEAILPRFSDASVHTRELTRDRASDDLWWWTHNGSRIELAMTNAVPLRPFAIASSVPALLPSLSDIGTKSAIQPRPVALVVMGLLLICAVAFAAARFIARRVFLVDLVQPLWLAQGFLGPRHVLCHPCDDASARRLFRDFKWIDLSNEAHLEAARTAPQSFDTVEQAVLIDHLDYRFSTGEPSALVRGLIDRLTRNGDRTVVLRPTALTVVTSSLLQREDREAWARILSGFIWVNGSRLVTSARRLTLNGSQMLVPTEEIQASRNRWDWRGLGYFEQFTDSRAAIERTLAKETDVDPYLETVMKGLGTQASGMDQLLDEIGERAEEYYTVLWHTCSASEQLALMQIAQTGLANGKTRKDVRRLLARGLLRRDAQLCLMNETFRRFVIAQSATSALAKELDQNLAGDAWIRFRVPFFAAIAVVMLFFFTTQRQTFDATIALIASLAASLPVFLRTLSGSGAKAG